MTKSNFKDITGQKFNRLTVIKRVENNKHGNAMWLCQCDCGKILTVSGNSLRNSHTKSCGCLQKEVVTEAGKNKFKDITGQKFGKLTVLKRASNSLTDETRFLCLCDCGNTVIVHKQHLLSGHTKSCGCLKHVKKHGLSDKRLYHIWKGMLKRCYNVKLKEYKHYGGRGISVCEEWLDSIDGMKNFYDWAMANGYDENAKQWDCTIDRIDNNGNYEPNNCRWASIKEQANNKRNNVSVNYKGVIYPSLSSFADAFSIDYNSFQKKYYYSDKSEQAIDLIIKSLVKDLV